MVSRVTLGYHTWAQVGAGLLYGLIFCGIMFSAWTHGWNEYGRIVETYVEDVVVPYIKSHIF